MAGKVKQPRRSPDALNRRRRERRASTPELVDAENARRREAHAATHTERVCSWCEATKPKAEFPKQAGVQICHACRKNPDAERKCSICKELKSSSQFEKGHGRKQCKECKKTQDQQRIDERADTEWECKSCNQVKPARDFHNGRRVCKDCVNAALRDRLIADPAWAEKRRAQSREKYERNPEPTRQSALKRWAKTSRPCAVCGQMKPPKGFVWNRRICKECFDSPYRKCLSCGEQRQAERFSPQAFSCKDCQNLRAQQWKKENPDKVREIRLKTRFGLSPEEKEAMEFAQKRLCAICRQAEELVIDHSHKSGEVRSLLCNDCNVGLGYFKEEESFFLAAVKYLRQPGLAPADIKPITDENLFSRFEIPNWEAQSRDKAFRKRRNSVLKTKYGITIDQYESLLAQGDGACWICARPETIKRPNVKYPDSLSVDHSHASGLIRGLLCRNCNWGIDAFKDDAERIEQALQYLAHWATLPPAEQVSGC